MAATLTFLLVCSLLQGALCGTFNLKMPKNLNVSRGSCVTIPCSFDVGSGHENNLDDTCTAYWFTGNAKLPATKEMTGDLTKKDCTTTFDNANVLQSSKYYFRLECNKLKYTFTEAVDISFIDHPPSLTLTPSTLEVEEGTSVSVTCSAPAPCWSHPPALTWTPNLGQSQETLQENQDKTKVKTSVMSFTASHLHHGNKISCTAVYRKQDGSPDVTAETSLSPVVSYSPKNVKVSVSPSGPVPENSNMTLTCSSNANPAVENYTWYRADGDQETFIGTGSSVNVAVSKVKSTFFCKATNTLGFKQSSNLQIDVQYSPKNVTVSVSPSGPVPENSNVTLTCSSNANPAVENYTWYRADGDQETFIGTGSSVNVAVSKVKSFFCNATNTLGFKRSSNLQIDVQYSPKNVTVSVSPSGPVPENSNVTLTCSSNANPAVETYTWYRADGDQENFTGAGMSLNIKVSSDRRTFFCKAENKIGVGRSRNMQIDVQFPPQILFSSDCTSTESQLNCSCETLGKPLPTIKWYLNGESVSHSDQFEIFNENRTILRSFFTLNESHKRDHLTLLCHTFNSLGSASQQFCVSSQQISTEHRLLYPVIISTLALLLLALLLYVFFIRTQKNPCKYKGHLTDENNTVAMSQPLTEEGNEEPNTIEECIYANADGLRGAENLHHANIAEPSSTDLPSSGLNNAQGGREKSDEKADESELIYSNVNWKIKSKKKKGEKSLDMNPPGRSYLEEETCMVRAVNRDLVSNAEIGGLYAQLEPRNIRKEVKCEYAQVKFKKQGAMKK